MIRCRFGVLDYWERCGVGDGDPAVESPIALNSLPSCPSFLRLGLSVPLPGPSWPLSCTSSQDWKTPNELSPPNVIDAIPRYLQQIHSFSDSDGDGFFGRYCAIAAYSPQDVGVADTNVLFPEKALSQASREGDSATRGSRNIVGFSAMDVMELVLVSNYMDMLKEIGQNDSASTLYMANSPGVVGGLHREIMSAFGGGG